MPAELSGLSQLPLRMVGNAGFGRGKHREMPPDDLLAAIAHDAFCPVIPALHTASRIEHEDRVLSHPRSQQTQSRLRLRLQPRDPTVLCSGHELGTPFLTHVTPICSIFSLIRAIFDRGITETGGRWPAELSLFTSTDSQLQGLTCGPARRGGGQGIGYAPPSDPHVRRG